MKSTKLWRFHYEHIIWTKRLQIRNTKQLSAALHLSKEQKELHIGVWANRHRQYLKQHYRIRYYNLLTSEKLYPYLADIKEQADAMFSQLVKSLAEKENVTEKLKCCSSHYLRLYFAHYLQPFSRLSRMPHHIIQVQLCKLNTVTKNRSTLFNPNEFADSKYIRVFCNIWNN